MSPNYCPFSHLVADFIFQLAIGHLREGTCCSVFLYCLLESSSLLHAYTDQHHLEMASTRPVRAPRPVFHGWTGLFLVSIAVVPSCELKEQCSQKEQVLSVFDQKIISGHGDQPFTAQTVHVH